MTNIDIKLQMRLDEFPTNLSVKDLLYISQMGEILKICRFCPFNRIVRSKPKKGLCTLLRNCFMDNVPICINSNNIDYPIELLSEIGKFDDFNGIPNECPYKFSRLTNILSHSFLSSSTNTSICGV